jgi:IclR family acetate operon transcriptional repressor
VETGDKLATKGATSVSSPTGTQAIDRAARLLTEVVDASRPVTFTELAAVSGLAKSTTSRLLLALERHGLLRREPAGGFLPGELFVRYAWQGEREGDLVEMARPFLERLGDLTGETINLGVSRFDRVEQIAQIDSRYMLGGANWIGRPVALHATALGKVLVAFGGAELPAGRLERCTSRTLTKRSALAVELASVRAQGYAITDEELEPGLVAVAAPVFRPGGEVVGALSVSGPASRLNPVLGQVAAHCVEQAAALSARLGYRQPLARNDRSADFFTDPKEGAA